MRTHFVLLIAIAALIGATPATAATPVLGPADGVQATRTDTTLVVTFTGDPAKWAPLVGRQLDAGCMPASDTTGLQFVADSTLSAEAVEVGTAEVGADGVVRYALTTKKPFDFCVLTDVEKHGWTVMHARAALSPGGAAWVDESVRATALRDVLARAAGSGGYRPLAAIGPGPVAQDGPAGAPGPNETGYWTDGARHAAASSVSAAGRHLVIEDLGGGMLRTNVLVQGGVLDKLLEVVFADILAEKGALDDDKGASPYRANAVSARDGVHGGFTGKRLTVRFTGRSAAAIRKVAGRRVEVSCAVRPPRVVFGAPRRLTSHAAVVRVPRRGATLRVTLPGVGDVCRIADDGRSVALVLATDAGRRWRADIDAIDLFARLPDSLAAPGGQAYLAPAAAVAGRKGVIAMAGPDATPPAGRVGVWTDGARHAVVAVRSASGRRMVMADEGSGMLRTNVFGDYTGLLALQF